MNFFAFPLRAVGFATSSVRPGLATCAQAYPVAAVVGMPRMQLYGERRGGAQGPVVRRLAAVVACSGMLALSVACGPKNQPPPKPPEDPAASAEPFENPGGMWMPSQLADQKDTLTNLGVELPLTDPTAFPLGAVVSLGGCSASFVSPKGLVITNHHCVTGYLQRNSTPDANLLEDGYLAGTLAEEKPGGPSARVYVTQSIKDVTDKVLAGTADIQDDAQRSAAISARVIEVQSACDAKDPTTACEVASYFDGAQFFEIEKLEIRDVRLVYAPHHGVGVFGGDVDNWRWPRHTGDYSFLRAYVGPDGKPADPSPNNVPYQPKHFLKVASTPLSAGDFVMVAGYPGRTYRLKTAAEVDAAVSWRYPRDVARYDELIAILEGLGKTDKALAIKTASSLKRLHNYRINFQGMIDGLQGGGLAKRKAELEGQLQAWIDEDPERKKTWGTVLADMNAAHEKQQAKRDHDAAVGDLLRAGEMLELGMSLAAIAIVRETLGAEHPVTNEALSEVEQDLVSFDEQFDPRIDSALLTHAATRAAALPEGQRPDAVLAAFLGDKTWAKVTKATDDAGRRAVIAPAVEKMVAKTKLATAAQRDKLLQTLTPDTLAKSRDPMLVAVHRMIEAVRDVEERKAAYEGAMARLRPQYVAALRALSPDPLAPDANGTLRISYGTVRGYQPEGQGQPYTPFTTISGMVAKHTGEEPFAAPADVLEAAKAGQWGPYADEAIGELPVDFLADLDITGGNSGSATINAKGELVGLAFDGNYESIASDWLFIPSVTRSIHVDIRYVLWLMDAVDGADHLLTEMGVTPSLPADAGQQAPAAAANEAPKPGRAAAGAESAAAGG